MIATNSNNCVSVQNVLEKQRFNPALRPSSAGVSYLNILHAMLGMVMTVAHLKEDMKNSTWKSIYIAVPLNGTRMMSNGIKKLHSASSIL